MVDYLQRAKFFRTKKRLGQNFLINPDVISDIIKFSGVTKDDVILEIGAGAAGLNFFVCACAPRTQSAAAQFSYLSAHGSARAPRRKIWNRS